MGELEYTYAVARIRMLETSLLTNTVIDQLLGCEKEEQCLAILSEKGWGSGDTVTDTEQLLEQEERKTWEVIREVAPDPAVFDVMSYKKSYHNLKAAIKENCTELHHEGIFVSDSAISGKEMLTIIKKGEFERLPKEMSEVAKEAYTLLLQTRDGQLCDVILDRAALEAIQRAGDKSKEEIIRMYADTTVAIANIKIAVRGQKTKKTREFMERAMAPCESINIEQLAKAAYTGLESLKEYLRGTAYAQCVDTFEDSLPAFERWCDDQMLKMVRGQQYQSFSAGPLVAYFLAREHEIKTVRIILTGKRNGFPEEMIRERTGSVYV